MEQEKRKKKESRREKRLLLPRGFVHAAMLLVANSSC